MARPPSPSLLGLPSELRNLIYELVLTAPSDLLYVRPSTLSMWTDHIHEKSRTAPALCIETTTKDRVARRGDFLWTDDPITVEYNMLKYVSKFLYSETAALELKFNCLKTPVEAGSTVQAFNSFFSTMSLTCQSWLSKVVLVQKAGADSLGSTTYYSFIDIEDAINMSQLASICNAYPKLRVDYVFKSCSGLAHISPTAVLTSALQIACALRGRESPQPKFGAARPSITATKAWRQVIDVMSF
ncbi:hypothetical protein BU23DRAFT_568363 [Bimuria novae-zelandiae CBS 107.79]|uniref:Uncharacterized protein n=1 Tax=Bimuria novae-zelandiae CBS 107.79 TaxID=1447943 RepID=A0A6A5VAK2_9PLEO|nr:hypothetical protein BU23DRAFT_568363 [Bimuria novae-zelandiae CBS 107.79]